jgi:hypothetical protein
VPKCFIFSAIAIVIASLGVDAAVAAPASQAELQALQAQMSALAERLDRLEAANASLNSENAELRALAARRDAQVDDLQGQAAALRESAAVTRGDVDRVKGAEWAGRIKARGDLRYRHERIESEREVGGVAVDAADRNRDRVRARLGFDATVTPNVSATLLLSTGADDPRGTNQTLGGSSSRKSIGLDLAYADWRFMPGGNLVLGKQPYPVWRPLRSLFLDSDVNPEGGALRFNRGPAFVNLYGFRVSERYSADPAGENTDTNIFGLQAGMKFDVPGGETIVAAKYSVCDACQDHSPLYANNANGNTTYQVDGVNFLRYDYDILDVEAQVGVAAFDLPLVLTAGFAQNLAPGVEHDTAYALGANLGRAGDPRTWEIGALYQSVDKDALFGPAVDSDFGGGVTDSSGWVLRGGYAPVKNVVLNATYFLNTVNKDVGTELDFSRLQLDVNYRF